MGVDQRALGLRDRQGRRDPVLDAWYGRRPRDRGRPAAAPLAWFRRRAAAQPDDLLQSLHLAREGAATELRRLYPGSRALALESLGDGHEAGLLQGRQMA